MPEFHKLMLFAGAGIGAFALLLLIISVATPAWLDDGQGSTIGLFRKCVSANLPNATNLGNGCHNENRVTQGGLSVFGLLLLVFSIFATIAAAFTGNTLLLLISLGLMYFSSMFVMSAYATWGAYSRDFDSYSFPYGTATATQHTSMGYSYNLCVAAHFFLWTALTCVAFGVGNYLGAERNSSG
ncbi:unnamed protein product [Rotaria socialis]|uniref:Uncharacterized protein n=1 Tax=Rotaria socialis TaxID=392032 RepID=A0A818W6S9_9BILA|nr:unnamed protein product [Rotaria socialis]CAF3203493.1 unnamed protein product [Rotaria socialis]CAF3360583.1 unnamed protein product [Rotaria socialis]CAF3591593.1 unnamed protein product [Rotaria socialis]CAF3721436.1 unnamed protein product [Rotaria socialis]